MMLEMEYAIFQGFDNLFFTWQGTVFEVCKAKSNQH